MGIKDIKAEARHKLALNMHQSIVMYTVQFAIFITLFALVVLACLCFSYINKAAAIVMIFYGIIMLLIAMIGSGMLNFAMVDHYIASYKCKPYNVYRLGDTLARNGVTKILLLNVRRVLFGTLLSLVIVPGVIYFIRTSMAAHLLIANPKMSASTALAASNKVMSGKTGAYFSLMMSLFGWIVLGIVTLGLGFIFVTPYINMCKTVYYKRILQGDRNVYKTVVQPLSPVIPAPVQEQEQQVNVRPIREEPVVVSGENAEPQRPIVISNEAVPPINTLGAEDIAEMNAAMRDFGADVPEVPITPVTKPKTTAPVREEPSAVKTPLEGSDIVEIVKPLTTREVDESDVMGKRIDRMFSQSQPKPEEEHDYMSGIGKQSPDDFVTSEVSEREMPASPAKPADDFSEPVMSDREFAEFIRTFDVPEQQSEFKPLTRSETADKKTANPSFGSPVFDAVPQQQQPQQPQQQPRTPQRQSSYMPPPARVTPTPRATSDIPATGESRTDRARREREERLKNLRK